MNTAAVDGLSAPRPSVRGPATTNRAAMKPSIACVVPAFNESANLPRMLRRLGAVLADRFERWTIVLVDDGSSDATELAVAPFLAQGHLRYVGLSRNFGKEAALTAGLDRADADLVLLIDADLQHPPELIDDMLRAWRDGADMVYTVRASRGDESLLKRVGTRWFYRLVNTGSRTPIPADAGDFRLLDRSVATALASLPERNRFMKGLYAWVGFASVAVPYEPEPRHAGDSSYSVRGLFRLAATGLTAFTNAPLRLWSALGTLIAVAAMLGGGWIALDHYVSGSDVPGWATLAVSALFFSGVQLLSIGILGEYVGRIFDEVKQRPVYIVRRDSEAGHAHGIGGPAAGR